MTVNEILGAAPVGGNQPGAPSPTQLAVPLPLPSPFITAPGLANLRDLGGHPIAAQPEGGHTAVKRGILFRSAELSKVGEEGVAALRELNITHVFDLRSTKEFSHDKDGESFHGHTDRMPAGWEAERVFVPVFLDQDYSPAAMAERFNAYSDGSEVSDLSPRTHLAQTETAGAASCPLSCPRDPHSGSREAGTAGERRQVRTSQTI